MITTNHNYHSPPPSPQHGYTLWARYLEQPAVWECQMRHQKDRCMEAAARFESTQETLVLPPGETPVAGEVI